MNRSLLLLAAAAVTLVACGDGGGKSAMIDDGAAAPTADAAEGMPTPRAGLWETTTIDETMGGPPEVSRTCVGDSPIQSPEEALKGMNDPGCKITRSKLVGGEKIHSVCSKDGVKFVTDAVFQGHATAYSFSLDTQATLPSGDKHRSRVVSKSRRIGDCPPGVKPGNAVAVDQG